MAQNYMLRKVAIVIVAALLVNVMTLTFMLHTNVFSTKIFYTSTKTGELMISNTSHGYGISDPRDPRFYNIILEEDAVMFKPCEYVNKAASINHSAISLTGFQQNRYQTCLQNRRLYVFGDSTTRAWYKNILKRFQCLQTTEKWQFEKWHKDSECYNRQINFKAGWYPHAQPFFGRKWDTMHSALYSISERIDRIPRKERAIVYSKILYEVFEGLHDRVVLLNNRDTTIAQHVEWNHPPDNIINAMIDQMLSYACAAKQSKLKRRINNNRI